MRTLIDASILSRSKSGRSYGHVVDAVESEVSAITLAELTYEALAADDAERPRRVALLSVLESGWDPLPVDADVARELARLVAAMRPTRRRLPVIDVLVAATAIVHELPLFTRDRDYDGLPDVRVIRV